jgi:soluble lytic murein transglycosylase-like protein
LDRQDIDTRIQEAAVRHGVDADLIRAVIEVESGFDPRAVSPAGARGLMQLMPTTAADLGVQNPFDPGQNIDGGTRYLKQLLGRYGGNRRLALAAYNWGMGNLEKRPEALPRETQRYLVKVEQSYRRYAGTALARADGRV